MYYARTPALGTWSSGTPQAPKLLLVAPSFLVVAVANFLTHGWLSMRPALPGSSVQNIIFGAVGILAPLQYAVQYTACRPKTHHHQAARLLLLFLPIACRESGLAKVHLPLTLSWLQVRGKLYELLANCLPPTLLLRQLATELIRKVDEEVQHIVISLAAQYEHRLQVRVAGCPSC